MDQILGGGSAGQAQQSHSSGYSGHRSAGVVISKSCFDRLGMVKDEEVEFTITLATDTNKKVRTVLFGVDITVGEKTVKVLAIVLEGLHFDVLLGVSWMQEAKVSVLITEGVLEVDGKHKPYKSWPEPAAFVVDEGIRIYCTELSIMKPRRSMGVPVRHTAVTGGEIYYVKYKEEVGVFGEILQVVGADGQLGRCVVSGTGEAERVLQRGQCMGYLFPLLNIDYISNKITSTYSVFCTIDILLYLRHLAEPWYSEFYNLLARWSNVFSHNKYNVGITKEEYAI